MPDSFRQTLEAIHRPAATPWLICPESDRWLHAVRRFAADLIPATATVEVIGCEPAQVSDWVGPSGALILWVISATRLGESCDSIAKTSITRPRVLQLAAVTDLSPGEQSAVSELGVAALLRHPEQLPKLAKMIRVYFAHSTQLLD